jgi:hypothetical protein
MKQVGAMHDKTQNDDSVAKPASNSVIRKSLAVDQDTYDMLQEICNEQGWTKIEALKRLIRTERDRIMGSAFISRP